MAPISTQPSNDNPIRSRARDAEDKELRRSAILDAAERLLIAHPDRMANMAEVAQAAGLAKGTMYLYFPSKEELLLALHERHVLQFFADLDALLLGAASVSIDDILKITQRRIVDLPTFLPLASICLGTMQKAIPAEAQLKFHLRIGELVNATGPRIEQHFPALRSGVGATLLMHSYALIVGLWQMLQSNGCLPQQFLDQPELKVFVRDYRTDLDVALRALWQGHINSQTNGTATVDAVATTESTL